MGTFYDREIEYLESTGTQYIDTGINFIYGVNEIEIYLDVRFNSSSERQLMGSNGYGYLGINVNDYFESSCGVTTIQRDFDFHKLKLIISPSAANISFTVDSTTITAGYTLTSYIYRCYLFALGGRDNAAASFFCDACIKRAYIIIDNKKVRDFIPVRVGNVGYLFDRVSCQLFGNAGTGSFVLGPDMYDSRIEYVGIRQGQYIVTDYVPSGSDIIINTYLKFQGYSGTLGWNQWFYKTGNPYYYSLQRNNNATQLHFELYDKYGKLTLTPVVGTSYHIRMSYGSAYINNTSVSMRTARTGEYTGTVMQIGHPTTSVNEDIYYFKIYKASVLVLDLIPVRKGQVGYLYDRITNQLFGNSGTGDLLLGNDVPDIPSDYDAEVDYIVFDGTQAIDTGLYGDLNTEAKVVCRRTSNSNVNVFGSRLNGSGNEVTIYASGITTYVDFYDGTTSRLIKDDSYSNWLTIRTSKDVRQIDTANKTIQVVNATQISTDFTTPNTMRIGGFEGVMSIAYRNFIGQMGAVQIKQNGVLVRDFIPVRKNGVGYLYDKITQKMFGNEFLSSFGIGADKEKPIPITPSDTGISRYYSRRELLIEDAKIKPYITSGLVFHLDGEDYDDTTKTWEDRVAHYVFTMTNTTVSTDGLGGVYFNGSAYSTYANFMAHAASSFTLEVVYNKTGANASVFDGGTGYWIGYRRVGNNVWRQTGKTITVCPETYGKVTHALTNAVSIYNGKSLGFTTGSTYYNRGTNANGYIGRDNNNQYRMVGNIYQIRLYNRKLTNTEIYYNQEIDRKRYGITFK